jgi:hypothetical protein
VASILERIARGLPHSLWQDTLVLRYVDEGTERAWLIELPEVPEHREIRGALVTTWEKLDPERAGMAFHGRNLADVLDRARRFARWYRASTRGTAGRLSSRSAS